MEAKKTKEISEISDLTGNFLMPKLAELLDEINEKLPASKNIKNNSMTIFDLKWVNGVIENSSQPMINVVDLVPWFITQVKLWKDNRIIDEINLQIESREITVLGFFKNIYSEGANIFQQVSENFDDDCLFGIVSNEQIFNKYNAKDGTIILFKKFDENRVTFKGELTTDSLDNFINIHSLPLIVHYNSKYSNKIYTSVYENHLYIIKSKNDKNFDEFIEEISKSAREFRGNMMFVIFNPDNDNEIDFLANSLHIDKEYLPRIIFDGLLGDERILHKPENPDVNVENVEDFISRFRDDGLIKLYLTQDVPSDWDKEPVKIVARNNFADVILDENKNVLVLFYQPDIHLHLEWIMIELAEKYRKYNDIDFAKLNLKANGLMVAAESPDGADIYMYKKKTNEHVVFYGDKTKEYLSEFIDAFLDDSTVDGIYQAENVTLF